MTKNRDFSTLTFFVPVEIATGRTYRQWLSRRARVLRDHDRNAGNHVHDVDYYRRNIDSAMRRSSGLDEYNGKPIDWMLAFENRTAAVGAKKRRGFASAPSIDHITGGGAIVAICRDDTNTAKGCMTARGF